METTAFFPKLGLEFHLNRVAFSIGDFEVYWYGIILGAAMLLGVAYLMYRAKEFGVDSDRLLDVVMVGAVFGVLGARLYYLAFSGESWTIKDFFDFRSGGLGFYGTVIGALLGAFITCRVRKVAFLPTADMTCVAFLAAQGIGRWANFINQEAFGCNTELPWGMTSSTVESYLRANMAALAEKGIAVDPLIPVHPTFLYESIWYIVGFLVLNAYVKRRKFDGELALMYFAWNGAGRAVVEGLRTDSLYIGQFRVSQLLAAIGCAAAIVAIAVIRGKIKKSGDPDYLMPYGHTQQAKDMLAELEAKRKAEKEKQ